jgi:hypothetical protein
MPPTLYHYTCLATLQKIIESRIIRATHYASFEDKDELKLGIDRLLEAVRKHPVEERISPIGTSSYRSSRDSKRLC